MDDCYFIFCKIPDQSRIHSLLLGKQCYLLVMVSGVVRKQRGIWMILFQNGHEQKDIVMQGIFLIIP